jgi:SpoIID/LytB domain protein
VVEGTGIYGFANCKYRGTLTLLASNGKIKLLNVLPLEEYIYGVVPRESPSGWRTEALRAQAVAARSYAYVGTGDLYCTTSSQAYQGYGAYNSTGVWVGEAASTNAAVDATKNKCVKSGSTVVKTYFFSQSGGHTANNEDVWVGGTPLSYVRGVPDPYEYLASPPYSPWPASKEKTYSGLEIADKLRGLTGVPPSPTWVTGVTFERAESGHVRYATFRFSNGASAKIKGDTTRSRLGLLSTAFTFSGFPIDRIQGQSRYDTAVRIAREAFPATAANVVIASGENYADALTGSGLAGAVDGPLLLTAQSFLPDGVQVALSDFSPTKVYVMGGTAAVDDGVVNAIKAAAPGASVERISGKDRYETARLAAARIAALVSPDKALLVSGTSWPDAASVSALAYAQQYPILLTPPEGLGQDAAAYLGAERPGETIIVGGTNAIAASVEASAALASGGSTRRLAGRDRYTTAAEVARYCISPEVAFTYNEVYMATGVVFADALTGGTLAGAVRKPLLLTHTDVCPEGTADFLEERKTAIAEIHLFGGLGAISAKGWDAIDAVMMR